MHSVTSIELNEKSVTISYLGKFQISGIFWKEKLQCDKDRITNLENELNGSKIHQNIWNTAKTMLRGKLRDLNACIKKKKDLEISDLRFYSKKLQGGEQSED